MMTVLFKNRHSPLPIFLSTCVLVHSLVHRFPIHPSRLVCWPLQTILKIQCWTSQCFCTSHPLRKDFQTLEFVFGIRFHRLNDEKVTEIQPSPGTGKPMCRIYPTTFFVNKVLLEHTAIHIWLHIVCGCFPTTMVELNSCERSCGLQT